MECKRIHLIEVKNFGRAIDPAKDIAAFFEVKKMAAEMEELLLNFMKEDDFHIQERMEEEPIKVERQMDKFKMRG